MKEVTKEEFRRLYAELGGGRDGWTESWWASNLAETPDDMRFMVEEPEGPGDATMWIVSDFQAREYRMFFRSEDDSDRMLEFPS